MFCNAFLVHSLTERDEIRHDKGHWCAAPKGFRSTLVHFSKSTSFLSRYPAHFLSERDEIWQSKRSTLIPVTFFSQLLSSN